MTAAEIKYHVDDLSIQDKTTIIVYGEKGEGGMNEYDVLTLKMIADEGGLEAVYGRGYNDAKREITPIEVLKNEIECDECGCNVPYDTAVQREQDAYDSGFAKAIEDVLGIIEDIAYEEDEFAEWTKTKSWHTVMRERVKALKEGVNRNG